MRYGQVAVELLVNLLHEVSEHFAVCRGVFQLVEPYIIMYHLVNQGIFQFLFRQVIAYVEAQSEVAGLDLAAQSSAAVIHAKAQIGFNVAQFKLRFGEFSGKHLLIELFKLFF